MNKLSGLDLIDYAVEMEVDFLAFAVSPWHMLGVQAVIEELKPKYGTLHGLIAICKNVNGHYTINPELYENMQEVEFVYYNSEVKKDARVWDALDLRVKRSYSTNARKFFLVPYEIDVFLYAYYIKKMHGVFVECYILDEGLGTYLGIKRNKVNDQGKYQIDIKESLFKCIRSRYRSKLDREHRYNDFSILRLDEKNEWVKNERSVLNYEKALKKKFICDLENAHMYDNAILINTQPFMGVGIPEGNEDITILLELCRLCKENGINVVIKPHPGQKDLDRYEVLNDYVCYDLRKELSQEEILSSLENMPRAVVAYSSTTLLTSKLFYGIPAYSLAKILLTKKITDVHKIRLDSFISTFKNQVEFIDSVDSIIDDVMARK